ncbi:Tetratricopeptide repeat protein 15 [Fusarium austroafricanum]|uniref:Tetratricopeptide repeat protein 15 n=1 Tax=Fusarium austroafricanum TaxID=2364996 RepID=A0A8H4NWG0_9HYPO|nr:Tetratricopeptide repeat protein 15 [Fusarium austroafricanum]
MYHSDTQPSSQDARYAWSNLSLRMLNLHQSLNENVDQPAAVQDLIPGGDLILAVGPSRTLFRISSSFLCEISPVFAVMFGPNFEEGHRLRSMQSDTEMVLELPDDDAQVFSNTIRVLYGADPVTKDYEPAEVQQMAVLVDKYNMISRFTFASAFWFSKYTCTDDPEETWQLATAAFWLQNSEAFFSFSKKLVKQVQVSHLSYVAGMPDKILGLRLCLAVEEQRVHMLPGRDPLRKGLLILMISQLGEAKPKDFSFLLRPEIYHPLTPLNVPVAFRNPQKQPDPEAPIEELLASGHFRAAAIAAVQELTGSGASGGINPTDSKKIFELLYTRLACLTLIDATPLAAQEVKALEDLNDIRKYVDETTGEHLVPWELRVLNVRLQSLGFGDYRRAVMSYHDLAREARERISKAAAQHDNSARELWKARLYDLGIQVAGALIELEDLTGAAHHLNTLRDRGDGKMALTKALLWLHLGDADSARDCARQAMENDENAEKLILALCDMADAEYETALEAWKELKESMDDEMVGVNTAVCLLYLGRIQEGRAILEGLVDSGLSSHTLLFNLSTMYELCTERHKNLKTKLTERVAGMEASAAGWEKTNSDFKL